MDVSVVIPIFNERENLPPLYQALRDALGSRKAELVCVDDGPALGSRRELERLARTDAARVRVVELRRNFGQTAAIAAGIDHAQGEVIVLIDADLQNEHADITMMLD